MPFTVDTHLIAIKDAHQAVDRIASHIPALIRDPEKSRQASGLLRYASDLVGLADAVRQAADQRSEDLAEQVKVLHNAAQKVDEVLKQVLHSLPPSTPRQTPQQAPQPTSPKPNS
ncbi:MAG: hypothetical protein AAFV53_00250 [Myxococcota bacterium]